MGLILAIESSTKNCSVAVSRDSEIITLKEEHSDRYIHSEKLHSFIDDALNEAGIKSSELDAIVVDKGPGSYTGLRIGVSAAKGLCYSLGIPLLAVDSLTVISKAVLLNKIAGEGDYILPMIDARRMEVYCALYDHNGNLVEDVHSRIIDPDDYANLEAKKIYVAGDGMPKALQVLPEKFIDSGVEFPGAAALSLLGEELLNQRKFEDVAYFEPYYLKDFIAGKPKKLL